MSGLNPDHVAWCRRLFDSLADGGTWAIPRNGLIFRRRGDRLVLTLRMPHDPQMPISAAQLRAEQDQGFEDTRVHFGAAGIAVCCGIDPTTSAPSR